MRYIISGVSATSTIFVMTNANVFVATKDMFCRNKSMLVVTKLLWRQTYSCHHKSFVATNIFLSPQTYFCRYKTFVAATHTFVMTKDAFWCDKNDTSLLVAASANDNIYMQSFSFSLTDLCVLC